MKKRLTLLLLWVALIFPIRVSCYEVNKNVEVYGFAQIWMIIHEQMEETNGLFQNQSRDAATDYTTGFRVNRARLGANVKGYEGVLGASVQLKLEAGVEILDLYGSFLPFDWLEFRLGQFKFPSVRENMQQASERDFMMSSMMASTIADYSLSRTNYASSIFAGNRSLMRDLGAALLSNFRIGRVPVRAMAMIGNGLGGNLFFGGRTAREYVLTNGAQFFYGARLEVDPFLDIISLGGHLNYNKHDNIVFNSGRTVYDLYRKSCSGDLRIRIPQTGLQLTGTYGYGIVLEDYDQNKKVDFEFSGWDANLVWRLNPLIRLFTGLTRSSRHYVDLSFRYELYTTKADEVNKATLEYQWTAGITYGFAENVRVRFNAIFRLVDEPYVKDLDDNAYLLSVQFNVP